MDQPRALWLQQVDLNLNEMGMARHPPGWCSDRGPWSTGGKCKQLTFCLAHTPIPDLSNESQSYFSEVSWQVREVPTLS